MYNPQNTQPNVSDSSGLRLFERDQSLERLRYLEDMIQRSSREELAYAIKLLAMVLVDTDDNAVYLDQHREQPTEADIIYGLVLHASIALEKAKKGIDPTTQLLHSLTERELKAQLSG